MKRTDSRKKARVRRKRTGDVTRSVKNQPPAKIELVRPDDLLHLQIEGVNLQLDSRQGSPVLVVDNPSQSAYLRVIFSPQTITETAVFAASTVEPEGNPKRPDPDANYKPPSNVENLFDPGTPQTYPPGAPPGNINNVQPTSVAQIGHPTRLVFKVPPQTEIPFSTEGLLDWTKLELSVNGIAAIGDNPTPDQVAAAPDIAQPADTETAIELPYRLIISPTAEVTWRHRFAPFTFGGQTELWQTRLALKVPKTPDTPDGIAELLDTDPAPLRSHQLGLPDSAPLRAIWSPDFSPEELPAPQLDPDLGRTAMDNNDRHQIVVLTSAFHGYVADYTIELLIAPVVAPGRALVAIGDIGAISLVQTGPYVPQPFHATQLMLSAFGGWMHSRGHWDPLPRPAPPVIFKPPDFNEIFKDLAILREPQPRERFAPDIAINPAIIPGLFQPESKSLDLSEWVHIAAQGRDHYVRIVYEGELWPFRNRASLIKVTERKFEEKNGSIVAYLMQRMFIVVREPEKTFAKDDFGNPFKRVRLKTLVTPDIAPPDVVAGTRTFWVQVFVGPGAPDFFRFHAVGTDVEGNAVDFTVPMLFVSVSDVELDNPVSEYNAPKKPLMNEKVRACIVPGQKVALAPASKTQPNENTHLATESLNFVMDATRVQPALLKATVRLLQVRDLLGADLPTTIRLFPSFVKSAQGLDDPANKTGVFAQVVDDNAYTAIKSDDVIDELKKLQVDIHADQAGGFATPSLGVTTLSRALGPLAGKVEDAVADNFDPAQFFPKDGTQLFGAFDLLDLFLPKPATPSPMSLGENAPKMRTEEQDAPGGGKVIVTTFDWKPKFLEPDGKLDLAIAAITKNHGGISVLDINGTITRPINPAPGADSASSEFTGTLNDFQVSVLDSVVINFVKFSFTKKSKQKPDVTVQLDPAKPVEFGGDLKFIEEIRNAIPPGLFGDGPSLDLIEKPLGIRAGFAFALPPLTVGVFALKDVKLDAALTLPFIDGKPVFDFNISERPHPFLLTVAIFGGGGFFHLQLDTAGMKELEVALEFGATGALDIGVASGEVHMMAGIYFSLQRKENTTQLAAVLSGYLRIGGSLQVLGLVKVCVEFNLTFTYDSGRDKAYGRATLTVHVEVLFFSASVELTVERAFGGKNDPHFIDFFPNPKPWHEYALAYA
jgi:hypothetical protein